MKLRIWHSAYVRWYDHNADGHRARAAAWGWVADRLCYLFWPAEGESDVR